MIKTYLSIFLFWFLFLTNANTTSFNLKGAGFNSYNIGQTIQNEVSLDKKITLDLSPGEWEIVEKTNWQYNAFSGKYLGLVKLDKTNNELVETLALGFIGTNGKRHADVNTWIYEVVFTGKHDGCYKRPEYYQLN